MELYIATADYLADFSGSVSKVLSLTAGEKYEMLELDSSSRHHQEWWGVRSLSTGLVGYVPSKFLQFLERIPEEVLSLDHQAERERQLRQLDTMQQEDGAPLPDIYKVPPVQVQSIDEWTNAEDDKDDGLPVREEPLPGQNGRSSGVVLRHKQEQTKSIKTRKSFIDRFFGSKNKDKESKKEKKKGKAEKPFAEHNFAQSPNYSENEMELPKPPEPEVDYLDVDNNENDVPNVPLRIIQSAHMSLEDLPKYLKPASSAENLVEPKKLPNPVGSSKLHQDLHREMENNRRMGVNVLQQKTELKKEFERREDRLKKKEREETEKQKKTEIQKRLEEQKQKKKWRCDEQNKKEKETMDEPKSDSGLSEFHRIRTKIYSNKPS